DGKEVAQLYVSKPESKIERAVQELKGFKKVFIKNQASENVTIQLPLKELAYYNVDKKQWMVEPGTYKLKLGKSSRDIVAETIINIK
ncbi:MAG: fibronectin type III-like domain-contianing protein, partial [Flavobacteriales bacterium]